MPSCFTVPHPCTASKGQQDWLLKRLYMRQCCSMTDACSRLGGGGQQALMAAYPHAEV